MAFNAYHRGLDTRLAGSGINPKGRGGGSGSLAPFGPLRKGGDYDCSGGGGNGPYYTQPGVTYTVTGSDPYGLDGNGDGSACS